MTGPSILIVSYNWPPRNAVGTHRPYAWAKYWSEAGAAVTVLTAAKRSFDAPLDLHLPDLPGVRVIETPYGGTSLSLIDRWSRHDKLRTVLKRIRGYLRKTVATTTDPRGAWQQAVQGVLAAQAPEHDFIVSTYGPEASHLIAYDAKRINPDLVWVADYRDLWSQNPGVKLPEHIRAQLRTKEAATVGQHADIVTAVSEDMIEKLGEFCTGRLVLSPNGFDLTLADLRQIVANPHKPSGKPLRLVHTGTVYAGLRDPSPLLEALADMADREEIITGDITVDFYGERVDPIRKLMENPRFRPFLRTPGHVSRDEALRLQRTADMLLLLESPAPEARGVLTGKLFEYISAGRPIICVGSRPDFEIGKILQQTGTGQVGDPAKRDWITDIIRQQVSGAEEPEWFAPRLSEISRYTRKGQSMALLAEMTGKANASE